MDRKHYYVGRRVDLFKSLIKFVPADIIILNVTRSYQLLDPSKVRKPELFMKSNFKSLKAFISIFNIRKYVDLYKKYERN